MTKATHYTFTRAARALNLTYSGVRKLVSTGMLEEGDDVRGIRTVTADSLYAELQRRGLPIPNGGRATDA